MGDVVKDVGGQPTTYRAEYNEKAKEYLARGKSIIQLARYMKVARSTIYKWAKDNEAFSDTLKQGQELSQAHWEDKLEEMMYSKEVNAPLVKLYFANRFKWHDKPEQENPDDSSAAPIKVEIVATDASKPKHTSD